MFGQGFGFGRDSEKPRKKSKFNRFQRQAANFARGRGHKGLVNVRVVSEAWDKDKQRPRSNWKAIVSKGLKGSGRKTGGHGKRGKRRGGGGSMGSFAGMDSYLSRLLGDAVKTIKRKLRPSESLAERKQKLAELLQKMDRGIAALKQREAIEDRTQAEYMEYKKKLIELQATRSALMKAWKDAHKRGTLGGAWPFDTGPSAYKPSSTGWVSASGAVSGDPSRRGKKGKKGKKKTTKTKMKASAKRMWRRLHAIMNKGKTLKQARAIYRAEQRKAGKPVKSHGKHAGKRGGKRGGKRTGRDYGGFPGWGF